MTFTEYQSESQRTCPSLGDLRVDISHMVLGINSEINELQDAIAIKDIVNISEEIADTHWYISNMCRMRGYDYDALRVFSTVPTGLNSNGLINMLYREISLLQDVVKKNIAYGKSHNDEVYHLGRICWALSDLAKRKGIDIHQALFKNIEKLKARYPEKFTTENALNRDLEKERDILER